MAESSRGSLEPFPDHWTCNRCGALHLQRDSEPWIAFPADESPRPGRRICVAYYCCPHAKGETTHVVWRTVAERDLSSVEATRLRAFESKDEAERRGLVEAALRAFRAEP